MSVPIPFVPPAEGTALRCVVSVEVLPDVISGRFSAVLVGHADSSPPASGPLPQWGESWHSLPSATFKQSGTWTREHPWPIFFGEDEREHYGFSEYSFHPPYELRVTSAEAVIGVVKNPMRILLS